MARPAVRIATYLGLPVFGLAVGLLIVEVGLRIAGVSYPATFDIDLLRGNALHPGAEGWQRGEGEAYVRINSHGLRDREHEFEKPPDTFRIAVLGDSFAEAVQVPMQAAFWSVLERKLSDCPAFAKSKVEVINFGISGHGTTQEYLTLRHYGWKYDPDLVLLAFYTGNDVRNNSRALEGSPYRPYFFHDGNKLVLDDEFRKLPDFTLERARWISRRNDLINASRILQLARELYNRFKKQGNSETVQAGAEIGINDAIYLPPENRDWKAAWRVTEAILRMMHRETKSRGAEFWIVTLTTGIQVHPDRALRRRVMTRLGVENLLYPDRRIEKFARQDGISIISLVEPFQAHADAKKTFLHGFDGRGMGHWNADGHSLAGKLIAARLCAARAVQ